MNFIWITIFVAFCILCGFIYIFKKGKKKKKVSPPSFIHVPRKKFISIYTVECKKCNSMDMICYDNCQPNGDLELSDIEIKWDTEDERDEMLFEHSYMKCEKHNQYKSVCYCNTITNY